MYVLQTNLPDDVQKEYLELKNIIWFVCYNEDNIWMGFGAIRFDISEYPHLGPTFVRPEFRGNGVQRKLIQTREEWARKNNFKGLTTYVYDLNIYSKNNIEACGFKKTGNYCDEIWYFKPLGN